MSDRLPFRWATTGTRVLAGTLVAAGFVVATVTAVAVPWPTVTREPVSIVAVPAPEANVLACDGALLVQGRDAAAAGSLTAAAPQAITSGVPDGAPEPTQSQLAAPVPDSVAAVFTALPQGGERTDVAAAGSATVTAPDLIGFAAAACRPPLMESWLVGGSTTTGASDLVILANPGAVASTVQLTVYGTAGPAVPAGGDLVIAPNSQRAIPLSGLALGEASPVIRVTATGAPVVAALQTSLTRTLLPGGVDQVGAMIVPDPQLLIPGVTVTLDPGDGSGEAGTVVRLLSPSADTTATVTATAVDASSPAVAPLSVPLPGGMPVDLELPGLAQGEYTVRVTADVPLVGAVWETTGFGEGSDFAWYMPAPEIAVPSLVAIPAGPAAAIIVANPSDSDAQIVLEAVDGSSSSQITVAAGRDARLSVRPGTVYSLDAGGVPVRAGVTMSGDGALAGYPLWSADQAAKPITVYP
jgi:hypothetical protein